MFKKFKYVGLVLFVIYIFSFLSSYEVNAELFTYGYNATFVQDCWVNEESPDSEQSSHVQIYVRRAGSSGYIRRGLIEFSNISSLPSNATLLNATLYIYYFEYADNDPNGDDIDLQKCTEDWTDSTTTWNAKPNMNASITDTYVVNGLASYEWHEWNVTLDMLHYINSELTNEGWYVRNRDDPYTTGWYSLKYHSNETASSGYEPYLEVYYALWVDDGNGNGSVDCDFSDNILNELMFGDNYIFGFIIMFLLIAVLIYKLGLIGCVVSMFACTFLGIQYLNYMACGTYNIYLALFSFFLGFIALIYGLFKKS